MAELEFVALRTLPENMDAAGIESILSAGIPVYGLYFLYVELGGRHVLEIAEGVELVKAIYKNRRYRVIGVANGKAEAFELLRRIAADYLASGGGFDGFKAYLRSMDKRREAGDEA